MPPGWKKEYHVGVRATQSRLLVAFISAIPVHLRVRENVVTCSEVNFLAIHKKLRGKRLTPVLIKEITRRSNLNEIWQGLYTAGVVLPKPVSTCRYFHRAINWQKLYECGFSPLPANSKPQYQVRKYALPDDTSTKGLRPLEEKDLDAVMDLYKRYNARFDMTPEFSREEAHHWFVPKVGPNDQQVVWTYVVEVSHHKNKDQRIRTNKLQRTKTRRSLTSSLSSVSSRLLLETLSTTLSRLLTCFTTVQTSRYRTSSTRLLSRSALTSLFTMPLLSPSAISSMCSTH